MMGSEQLEKCRAIEARLTDIENPLHANDLLRLRDLYSKLSQEINKSFMIWLAICALPLISASSFWLAVVNVEALSSQYLYDLLIASFPLAVILTVCMLVFVALHHSRINLKGSHLLFNHAHGEMIKKLGDLHATETVKRFIDAFSSRTERRELVVGECLVVIEAARAEKDKESLKRAYEKLNLEEANYEVK